MTQRVIIESGGGSPLRISVAGVDASTAQFNDLIFDGNQPPLRLWSTGYVSVPVLGFADSNAARFTTGPSVPLDPSGAGRVAVFFCMVRQPTTGAINPGAVGNANTPAFRTYNFFGAGGGIFDVTTTNTFIGFNCNRDNLAEGLFTSANNAIVNFAILKNYQ